ncbi:pleckstrin homology domain-containing family F member 2-like [Halyomorpha halys]|uniref:pleckstrin homology domain-containing family F member 2-like n=1 Tax=Halyomorpha halys TaxID=286706 RepID=UPI0006D52388|nr:pleckstrin homology domain-containing family F member 2-like [Halyomorpha halys]
MVKTCDHRHYFFTMVDKLVNSTANFNRIKRIEECFGPLGKPLILPGRVLVGEGTLQKMCRKGLKDRIFFLFNDILVYGTVLVKKKYYTKQHIIPLEEMKIESLENVGEIDNGWIIKTPAKSFTVYSATPLEKEEWMSFIQRFINNIRQKNGKKNIEAFAAVWVPDTEAEFCMCCRISEFSVINRRHHCRNCGNVVCRSCSRNKFVLNHMSSKPVRVCRNCFIKLSKKLDISDFSNTRSVVPLNRSQSEPLAVLPEEDSDDDEVITHSHVQSLKNVSNNNNMNKRQSVFYELSSEDLSGDHSD